MELNVCWMYHDIMDLYGDKGNMMVLQKRCEERGISIPLIPCPLEIKGTFACMTFFFWVGAPTRNR